MSSIERTHNSIRNLNKVARLAKQLHNNDVLRGILCDSPNNRRSILGITTQTLHRHIKANNTMYYGPYDLYRLVLANQWLKENKALINSYKNKLIGETNKRKVQKFLNTHFREWVARKGFDLNE